VAKSNPRARTVRPQDLVIRCLLRDDPQGPGQCLAICIALDLYATGKTPHEASRNLDDAIRGYLITVLEAAEGERIAHLLNRPAPLRHRLHWHWLRGLSALSRRNGPLSRTYEETIPILLAVAT